MSEHINPRGTVRACFLAAAILVAAGSGFAQSGVDLLGQIQMAPIPNSLLVNAFQSDVTAELFLEGSNVILGSNVAVNATLPGTISAGTVVSDYLFHSDPIVTSGVTFSGSITFNSQILGVIDEKYAS